MCWNTTMTAAMVVAGGAATAATLRRGAPAAVPATLAYFTLMEALQLAGYAVIDQCGAPANRLVTQASMLHIALQPFVINAFAMSLGPRPVAPRLRRAVWAVCAVCTGVMLVQLVPVEALGRCTPGTILCGAQWCTVSGAWHIAWEVPFNGLLSPLDGALGLGWGFPTYMVAVFLLPLAYGAWRFVAFHVFAGPLLAGALTRDPNEIPAVWCLFSIGILLISLSPAVRRGFALRPVGGGAAA